HKSADLRFIANFTAVEIDELGELHIPAQFYIGRDAQVRIHVKGGSFQLAQSGQQKQGFGSNSRIFSRRLIRVCTLTPRLVVPDSRSISSAGYRKHSRIESSQLELLMGGNEGCFHVLLRDHE